MPFSETEESNDSGVVPDSWVCINSTCGNTQEFADVSFISARNAGGVVCDHCGAMCPRCDNLFNTQSGWNHAVIDGDVYCNRCTGQLYVCESNRGETHWFDPECDDWSRVQGDAVCEYCAERYTHGCDDCEQQVWDESDHEDYCNGGNNRHINGYDYRPDPKFHHLDGELESAKSIQKDTNNLVRKYRQMAYLGFELEMEADGNSMLRDAARYVSENIEQDLVYLKHDGSLNNGMEFVTHPMTLGYAMEKFPWDTIDQLRDMGMDGWNTDTAGLHVHVSRDGFKSDPHMARFFMFFMMNKDLMEFLSGRKNSRWCSFGDEHRRNIAKKLKGQEYSERYIACNINNSKTLEIRIFRSSLKPARVKMALQLVDAVVKYTDSLPTSKMMQKGGMGYGGFMTFIDKNQEIYPELYSYAQTYIGSANADQIGE